MTEESGRLSGSRPTDGTTLPPTGFDPGRELLTKVLDYYEGRKPYDFYRLSAMERSNQSFDAWQEIAGEISAYLGRNQRKRRKKSQGATQ